MQLKQLIIVVIIVAVIASAPIYPVEDTEQADVEYEVLDQQTGLTTGINQLIGIGTTSVTIWVRNLDNENGYFTITAECQTTDGNNILLTDETFIAGGNTGELTISTGESLNDCHRMDIEPPRKTVEIESQGNLLDYLSS